MINKLKKTLDKHYISLPLDFPLFAIPYNKSKREIKQC